MGSWAEKEIQIAQCSLLQTLVLLNKLALVNDTLSKVKGEQPTQGIPSPFMGGLEDNVLQREPNNLRYPILAMIHKIPLVVSVLEVILLAREGFSCIARLTCRYGTGWFSDSILFMQSRL